MVRALQVAQVLLPRLLVIASSQEHWGGVRALYMLSRSAHVLLPQQVLQALQARDSHIEGGYGSQVAQVLLPGLLVIASSQEYGAGVRRKALSIAHSLANFLSSKQSPTDKDTRRGLGNLLEAWMAPVCAILREPISGQVSSERHISICDPSTSGVHLRGTFWVQLDTVCA